MDLSRSAAVQRIIESTDAGTLLDRLRPESVIARSIELRLALLATFGTELPATSAGYAPRCEEIIAVVAQQSFV